MSCARPFYYLENFSTALAFLQASYGDLLDQAEHTFITQFCELPRPSAALLVRMIGRKGDLFPATRLRYEEIGSPSSAAAALVERGWVDSRPVLSFAEWSGLLRKSDRQLDWCLDVPGVLYRLQIRPLCERLRLLFFGHFEQSWSELVLTDLGIFRYERVPLSATARAFHRREHLDIFWALYCCRQQLEDGLDIETLLRSLPAPVTDNEWLEGQRRRVQFQIARKLERQRDFIQALRVYRDCAYPGSRLRVVRLLERLGQLGQALQTAAQIREQPADEAEAQQVARMWPRLQRKAGRLVPCNRTVPGWSTFHLVLPGRQRPAHLELAAGAALSEPDAPVHFVENGLIHSLFGLLCWEAFFAPVSGAFFHGFQAAPADLHEPGFRARRAALFSGCLAQLDSDAYRATICRNFEHKQGIQARFVSWGLLSESLLRLALECLPAKHLLACFERILANIRTNAAGLPDLVQFWPAQRRYRLIEVKGPGDRLQDNQARWLSFCVAHDIPVSVCQVSWSP